MMILYRIQCPYEDVGLYVLVCFRYLGVQRGYLKKAAIGYNDTTRNKSRFQTAQGPPEFLNTGFQLARNISSSPYPPRVQGLAAYAGVYERVSLF